MNESFKKPRTFKKIILEDLEKRGRQDLAKKIKSITYESFSMGNAVRVETLDLFKKEREELDSILKEYAYGRFDGMTDYAYSERDHSKERQAKYVTLNNRFSETIETVCKKINPDNYWETACKLESYDQAMTILGSN